MKNEIVLFSDGDISLEVELSPELDTVWLTQKQMETLFAVSHATVSKHINNILGSGELDETSVGFSDVGNRIHSSADNNVISFVLYFISDMGEVA